MKENKPWWMFRFCLAAAFVIYLWYQFGMKMPVIFGTEYPELAEQAAQWGTFGDMFGAVNALFAGLAFAGVIISLLMQSKELEYQREELQETQGIMKDQSEQMELQRDAIMTQTEQLREQIKVFESQVMAQHLSNYISNYKDNEEIYKTVRDTINDTILRLNNKLINIDDVLNGNVPATAGLIVKYNDDEYEIQNMANEDVLALKEQIHKIKRHGIAKT